MRKHVVVILCICIAVFLAYSNSLNGTWAMDDVVANRPVGINDLQDLAGFRKISSLTFLINQRIAPFNPMSFRLFNILIHMLNVLLVYLLTYRTTALWENRSQSEKPDNTTPRDPSSLPFSAALLSSVVFALHPININAVAYIVQRMASLSTFFILLSLLSYISAHRSSIRAKAVLLYLASGISIIAGIFSKENGVMAIPLILLYDYVFLCRFHIRHFLQKLSIIAVIGIASFGVATYFLNLHLVFLELSGLLLNPGQPLSGKDWTAVDVFWTPGQHILTEFRVLSRYLFLLLLPLPKFLAFDRWGYQVSQSITEPLTTLPSLALIVSLVLFSLVKLRRYPFLCFGFLWYFIAISLESFFALGSDIYFEHRNYLPLAGLVIGTAGQIITSTGKKMNVKKVCTAAVCAGIVLGSLTFARNFVWQDSLTLWTDTLRKNPSNLRAIMATGNAYLKIAEMDNAESFYKLAVRVSSMDSRLYYLNESTYSLGMIYLQKRDLSKAKELIEQFSHRIESYKPKILEGFYRSLSDDTEGALKLFQEILHETQGIDKVVVLTLMGDTFREKGFWDVAIKKYEQAVSLDPGFSPAYYGMGASYINKREIERAHDFFGMTLSIDPFHVLALSDMADLLLMMKSNPESALRYAGRAVEKSPPFYQPYLIMGNILIVLDREEEAESYYRKALEHGVSAYMVPFSKARAYFKKGNRKKALFFLSELQGYDDVPDTIRKMIQLGREDTEGKK
jgi:tetratricopeptide (TPR) repeat protein